MMQRASFQGKHAIWEIAIGGGKHSFGAGKVSVDLLKLYDDLVEYLQGEVKKGDQTNLCIMTGFEYEKASPEVIAEFSKL
ncbi:MAG: hypothetical protein M1298_00800 [Chloroflexi bacterium]|nr:hypothetical protein [Chloroflexota bacterium]